MSYTEPSLRIIYDRTDGHCHICHRKVHFKNYAKSGARGSWEVEHSIARCLGGTDHGNNLRPACVSCNRSKGTKTTRTARGRHGNSRAPLSRAKKENVRQENRLLGGAIGGLIGLIGGPPGVIFGATIGAALGHSAKPPKA